MISQDSSIITKASFPQFQFTAKKLINSFIVIRGNK